MAGKRRSFDKIEDVACNQNRTSLLLKRQKQDNSATDTAYNVAEISEFEDGISKIKDWKSSTVDRRHVQVIYWSDIEGLTRVECANRYPNKDGNPCSATAIYKIYNKYAPQFYAEKGLVFIPPAQRAAGRAQVRASASLPVQRQGHTGSRQTTSEDFGVLYKESRLDHELKELFSGLSETALPVADLRPRWERRNYDQGVEATVMQSDADAAYPDEAMLNLVCKLGEVSYECSSTIELKRACAIEYCKVVRKAMQDNPDICTIQYGPEFSADTISRFVACCSPKLQSSLPSHVTTGFGTFKQEWTMPELEDLYVLAISVGAFDVCDMVIDFWHKEMRRPNQRVVQDEFGDTTVFSILDFGPEFLNFLQENDVKGFYFFLNVLIMHGQAGYDLLRSMQLGNWHTKVKKTLTSAIKSGRTIDLVTISPKFVCELFHHHGSAEHRSCYKRQALGPLPQPAMKTSRPKMKASPTIKRDLQSPYNEMDCDNKQKEMLQISVPSFSGVHNRYARIDNSDRLPGFSEHVPDRLRQIKNSHVDNRMHYANPKHNAHHDTRAICEEKIRIVKEKINLFKEAGIELDDEEFERLTSGSTMSGVEAEEEAYEGEHQDEEWD